jgi:hypothetical protein
MNPSPPKEPHGVGEMSDINRWENEEEWSKKAQSIEPREYYIDCDDAIDHFCDSMNCHSCDGSNCYGEPNGDGCEEQENFLDRIDDINFENNPEYAIEIIKKRDSELTAIRSQLTECKAQIEAMRCCGNCSDNKGCTLLPRGQEKCSSWQPKGEKQ